MNQSPVFMHSFKLDTNKFKTMYSTKHTREECPFFIKVENSLMQTCRSPSESSAEQSFTCHLTCFYFYLPAHTLCRTRRQLMTTLYKKGTGKVAQNFLFLSFLSRKKLGVLDMHTHYSFTHRNMQLRAVCS